jgi:signal peptidase I
MDYQSFDLSERSGGLLVDLLQTVVVALAVSVIAYIFFAVPNEVEGPSMHPTLQNGEILLTNKFIQIAGGKNGLFKGYDYQRGDIVVFQEPNKPDLVKRIIGMPGEEVQVKDGKVIINNEVLIEPYLAAGVVTRPGDFLNDDYVKRIPDDSYMVLGDNRTVSHDSRALDVGFIKREYMKGRPFLRITPLNRFGLLENVASYRTIPLQDIENSNN